MIFDKPDSDVVTMLENHEDLLLQSGVPLRGIKALKLRLFDKLTYKNIGLQIENLIHKDKIGISTERTRQLLCKTYFMIQRRIEKGMFR
jgi:hypothetical protein